MKPARSFPATPSALFGDVFAAVQEARLFPDSKTFADAVPRHDPQQIMADWSRLEASDREALQLFVAANFDIPTAPPQNPSVASSVEDYIKGSWRQLTRSQKDAAPHASALALPEDFVVPGGRFRELYYWDSYFTMLGLVRSGRQDLVEALIENFGSLIDRYGHIPNGTRSYYLSRSHPPFFYLAAQLSANNNPDARRRRLQWMLAEHAFWMDGEGALAPAQAHRRVARLPDGAVLNRYWDDSPTPRDESWTEDVHLATATPDRDAAELWRDLRAAAESGWDFSSRWLGDRKTLGTIRTTRIIPIDLNSLLFGLEEAIAHESVALDEPTAAEYLQRANARAAAIRQHLWDESTGHYSDYDLDMARVASEPTAAMAFPLFVGLANGAEAKSTAAALRDALLGNWGLATTARVTGEQWDSPNGWAPLQWIACQGLWQYGENDLANEIADRWLNVVRKQYDATGLIFEKYNIDNGVAGGGGEYDVEIGFGWTNGVALALAEKRYPKNAE